MCISVKIQKLLQQQPKFPGEPYAMSVADLHNLQGNHSTTLMVRACKLPISSMVSSRTIHPHILHLRWSVTVCSALLSCYSICSACYDPQNLHMQINNTALKLHQSVHVPELINTCDRDKTEGKLTTSLPHTADLCMML